ncbi:MAG TPA: sterol desaturase family protein [Xanthobacteraceae bacterium]|nr:sterol desaturase family protein [Xanthobacteraceae bacterium]
MDLSPGISYFVGQLSKALVSPGSNASLASLFCAFCIGLCVLAARRRKKGRRVRLKPLLRALFPKRIVMSRSSLADVGYFYFHVFVFGLIFGWALLSYEMLSHATVDVLTALFGTPRPTALPAFAARSLITVMLFLAYELGYWLNHYLSHRIPFLWEFHKVHHTATVLTPLTNFRVHPVYMCIFINILALFTGLTGGAGDYLFGQVAQQYGLSETNIILVIFIYLYIHLQHSQLWISFTGWLGHLFMSPAHHQIHHSRNPLHFNKNLGSCLAVWDWMFGTLHIPSAAREALEFGVDPDRRDAHTLWGELIAPFGNAARRLKEGFAGQPPQPVLPSASERTRA